MGNDLGEMETVCTNLQSRIKPIKIKSLDICTMIQHDTDDIALEPARYILNLNK